MKALLSLLLTGAWTAAALGATRDYVDVDGVVAVVDDTIITYQQVELYIFQAREVLERQYANQPDELRQRIAKARQDGTEQLVERQLILREFKTAGYSIPESIIDDTIKERIKQRFGDRATLAKSLKEQGITYETFRQKTREEIIVDALAQKFISKELIISPQKVLDFYAANQTNWAVADEVKLRMIVLKKPPGGDATEAKKLAAEIIRKIDEGAPFEEMARIHSEGSHRALGGDWGWVERQILRDELSAIAFKLEKGKHSEAIDLPDAVYLMLVEDKRSAHMKGLGEVRDLIEKELLAREHERLRKKWIEKLRHKSFVGYF